MAIRFPIIAVPLVAAFLTSCVQEPVLDVRRNGPAIEITASRPDADTPPCIQGLTITRDGTDIAETPPVWAVSTADPNQCRSGFTYGQVPAGWSQSNPSPALQVGTRYLVEVAGPGLLGGRTFTMRGDDGPM